MTYEEFLFATGEELIDNAETYMGCEDGVFVEVSVDGVPVRIIGEFTNEDILDWLSMFEGEYSPDDYFLEELYQTYEDAIDSYFIDRSLEDIDRAELFEEYKELCEPFNAYLLFKL